MGKSSYKSSRNRRIAEPGQPGGRGLPWFNLRVTGADGTAASIDLRAVIWDFPTQTWIDYEAWEPFAPVPPGTISLAKAGVPIVHVAIRQGPAEMQILFDTIIGPVDLNIRQAENSLKSLEGWQCIGIAQKVDLA